MGKDKIIIITLVIIVLTILFLTFILPDIICMSPSAVCTRSVAR